MSAETLEADDPRAAFTRQGGFLVRSCPARQSGEAHCSKKLCFTSTAVLPMARVLYELSRRPDCWAVKLDAEPNPNGMVRGRCFMTTEEAVVELWLRYKLTDELLCTIQDDDFTKAHRK